MADKHVRHVFYLQFMITIFQVYFLISVKEVIFMVYKIYVKCTLLFILGAHFFMYIPVNIAALSILYWVVLH